MMKQMQLYARFRDWQRNPFHYEPMAHEVHRCLSCGYEYEGNFCPNCGQDSNTGRLGWHSVFAKMFDVWDVEKSSLPTTLLHLLSRPGYMICDYLDGRRRPYYSPVMLVFILASGVINRRVCQSFTFRLPFDFDCRLSGMVRPKRGLVVCVP